MEQPGIIEVNHLFPELYNQLIDLLDDLSVDDWKKPTSSTKWNVKDIAAHLLDGDLRRISFQRDNLSPPSLKNEIKNYEQLVEHLNQLNNSWVEVSNRFSPAVLIDLFKYTSGEIPKLFDSLDPHGKALFGVSWAGEDQSENWFDIAREYTEKWYHQQQIREAVGRPILSDEIWVFPLINTFVRGLPFVFNKRAPNKIDGIVFLDIEDMSNAKWIIENKGTWNLKFGIPPNYTSMVTMSSDTAWRIFSRNISKENAIKNIAFKGDEDLGKLILELTGYMK